MTDTRDYQRPEAAPDADAVTINVDGRPVQARKGELLIAAAERAGTYIPRFCYHPRMKPVGMCRMCLVEVKGPRGFALQPACFVPVEEGQEVLTQSDKVRKAQDGVLEFLLVNHPLDCPVCDKGGECPLQDQTISFGPGESRFLEEKRHFEKPIAISELVYLDRERCIQCARCTRFADELAGDPLIDFIGRGDQLEVNTYPDAPFASYFSGNTVQICPVGALTASPYRFRARPWDLEQVESTCTTCAVGCIVSVQSSANRITRYLGIDSDPVNQSWMCDRGRFDFEAVNSEDRLSHPLVRQDGQLVPTTWGDALSKAAAGIEEVRKLHGPAAVAVLGGARLANEDAYAWAKLAKAVIGTDSVDAQMGDGLPAELVLGLPQATIDEACGADAVILLGPDLKEELPVLHLRLRQAAVERQLPIIEITQTATGMTRHAAVSLTHRPGEAPSVVRALTSASAGGGTTAGGTGPAAAPADVAGVSGVSLAAAREILAGAGRVVVVLGRPSLAESAAVPARAALALAAAFPQARFLSALRRGNVRGALDMGLAPGILPGRVGLDQGRDWFARAWGQVPAERGMDASGILDASADGRVQALVLLGANPIEDFPDRRRAEQGLDGVGFIVAIDAFLTESSRKADIVLPAAVYSERPGTTTNLEGRMTRLGQKVVPPGVAWPDWMIAVELAVRLGSDLEMDTLAEIRDEIEALAVSHHGITEELLNTGAARDGIVAPLGGSGSSGAGATPGGRPGSRDAPTGLGVDTGGGSTQPVPAAIDPMSDPGIGAVEVQGVKATATAPVPDPGSRRRLVVRPEGQAPALISLPDAEGGNAGGDPSPPDAYSLRLVAGRKLYDHAVSVRHSPSLAGLAASAGIRVNPYDLDRLGLHSGDRVRISAPRGSFVLPAAADPGIPRGSAWMPFSQPDGGASRLIDSAESVTDVRLETVQGEG
ncbi:MAG TPA: NADH-quinone oxidoreductase subunit NuoG [Acidimicrobiales bacterium]|nr:NADH-quinone oxidoreductase subunit NuoG [Acidimicrobiales bacterium]